MSESKFKVGDRVCWDDYPKADGIVTEVKFLPRYTVRLNFGEHGRFGDGRETLERQDIPEHQLTPALPTPDDIAAQIVRDAKTLGWSEPILAACIAQAIKFERGAK